MFCVFSTTLREGPQGRECGNLAVPVGGGSQNYWNRLVRASHANLAQLSKRALTLALALAAGWGMGREKNSEKQD